MRILNRTITRIISLVYLLFIVLLPVGAGAQDIITDEACKVPSSVLCQESRKDQDLDNNSIFGPSGIITNAIKLLSYAIGIAAVVMMIVGGFKYVISTGDSSAINSAKNTILYALIGVLVAVAAQGIIVLVLNKL